MRHALGKQFAGIAATHDLQHGVAAALQGDMEMRGKMLTGCHKINDLVGEEVGFAATYADAVRGISTLRYRTQQVATGVRCKVVQRTQEVDESFAGGAAEVADIDAGEDDLFRAAGECFLRLLHERGDGRVAALAPRERDGAIRAEIVTSVLHLEEAPRAVVLAVSEMEVIHFADRDGLNFRNIGISGSRYLDLLNKLL